ncbi:hypothetical protein BDY17DRAFT_312139 [Neohortaea acidophila]|uniref:Uncharacterized protein n=1 Tax=Neohortaea acidophila TaxID=245834 RepID=A0A6A6PND9_9PEZI|nr:uncharacterized protein BDY17DRAFT_312139 [Neohortaea acidophila]KAF2481425.1 hypothetical protein BDY17DRAFT_312139 [Neohortaea acidophila]
MSSSQEEHWLDQYGNQDIYQWRSREIGNRTTYYRPLGLVEFSFDADGRYYEGRADMNAQLDLEVKCTLSKEDFRERVLFAWTCLRCKHLLLQSKAVPTKRFYERENVASSNICFAVDPGRTVTQAIEDAGQHLVFLNDHFDHVDPFDFWVHCQNTKRILDPEKALARFYVFPLEPLPNGRHVLRFLKVGAHQIEDGLTTYNWMTSFIDFLNQPVTELRQRLRELLLPEDLYRRLPPPQESQYPAVRGNRARQRWFWLLTRILRHVRKPLPAGFDNPLRKDKPRSEAVVFPWTYHPILDYSSPPMLNSISLFAGIPLKGTQRLHRICRSAKASIGAGCFALAALIMQEMYEEREPHVPLHERKPFISGFPLNPRAFFNHNVPPDSLMLAFSDGISLPFLPSHLDVEGRLRILARQAHRQLSTYQKRPNPNADEASLQYMGARGTGRMLPILYVSAIARADTNLPEQHRRGVDPQGAFPMRPNATMQTCGVSSVGRRENLIQRDRYDLEDDGKPFVADYRNIYASVRPREDEFLVGVGGDYDGIWVNCSIDGNSMDPRRVEQWKTRFETMLDGGEVGGGSSKL